MALSDVYPLRMAPPWKNPMKPHMLRQSWSTDRQFTHCTDPVTYTTATTRRHTVVQQRCNIALTTAQKRKQNHANTRAHQKTSSQHKKNTFSCVSEHIDTPKEPCTTVDMCCSPPPCCNPHCQEPSTATRHGHCPRC